LLSNFSKQRGTAQKKYSEFISQGKNQVFLGNEGYVSQILSDIDQNKDLSEIPRSQRKEKAKELVANQRGGQLNFKPKV